MIKSRYFLFLALFGIFIAGCKSSTSPSSSTSNGPGINSFTAMPPNVDFNTTADSSVLQWALDGSQTSVSIDQSVGDQTNNTNNSITVFPSATTTYTLTAKNANGTSTKTVTVTVTNNTGQPNSPPTPAQLVATGGSTSPSTINLSWTEPSGSVAASHYIIERWISGQSPDTINAAAPGPNSYSDAQLYPSFIYYYRIKAVSAAGAASGWSNTATATAPGTQPTISSIALTPTSVPTLTAGQTQQFTAIAYDQSNNRIPFAQRTFLWSSDNGTIVTVNGAGLASATTNQGSANITASLPNADGSTVTSNAVNIAVSNQTATTLVLFYGDAATDFTIYLAPLAASGVTFDQINDFSGGGAAQFTFNQIKGYSKVIVLEWNNTLSADAGSILAQYLDQGNKKLAVVAGHYGNIDGTTLGDASHANISQGGYGVTDLNPQVQGQSLTAFAGLNFTLFNSSLNSAITTTTFNGSGQAALIATLSADQSQQFVAFQQTFSDGSTLLFSGVTVDEVDGNDQNAYVHDFMSF